MQHGLDTLASDEDPAHAFGFADLQVPVFDESLECAKADAEQFCGFLSVIDRIGLDIEFLYFCHFIFLSIVK